MYSLINIPTRVTDSSASCIDHIWYNEYNVAYSGSFIGDISDHYLLFCVFNIVSNKVPIRKIIRDRSERNLQLFENSLAFLAERYFYDNANQSVNVKTEYFLDEMNTLYNQFCPIKIKTISLRNYTKPWITRDLVSSINYKHTLFKRYKQSIVHFNIYNSYKNSLCKVLKKAKIDFSNRKFDRIKNDTRESWTVVNDLMGRKKTTKYPELVDELRDPLSISNVFSDYFSSTARNLSDNIPLSNSDPLRYLSDHVGGSFFATSASVDEVVHTTMGLPNRGGNINAIPVPVYKRMAGMIAPIIVDIFNSSVSEGTFPSVLKMARIVPVYKSKNSRLVMNYRPISI